MARDLRFVSIAVAMAAALLGCSGAVAGSGAWGDRLEALPAPLQGPVVELRLADLRAAADHAGLDELDHDTLLTLLRADMPVGLAYPDLLDILQSADMDGFRAVNGYSPLDVDWAVELTEPPTTVAVLGGAFELEALEEVNGPAVDGSIVPDDFSVDLEARAPGRPLGRAPRYDLEDDRLAVSFREDDPREGARLSDDARVATLAAHLDELDAYTARILLGDYGSFGLRAVHGEVDDDALEALEQAALPEPFDLFGVALLPLDEGDVRLATFHHHPPDADVDAAAAALEGLLTGAREGQIDWTDRVTDVEVEVDGQVVIATMSLTGEAPGAWPLGWHHRTGLGEHR